MFLGMLRLRYPNIKFESQANYLMVLRFLFLGTDKILLLIGLSTS